MPRMAGRFGFITWTAKVWFIIRMQQVKEGEREERKKRGKEGTNTFYGYLFIFFRSFLFEKFRFFIGSRPCHTPNP
jgi:hypothetical protein